MELHVLSFYVLLECDIVLNTSGQVNNPETKLTDSNLTHVAITV